MLLRPNPLLTQIAEHSSDFIGVANINRGMTFLNKAGRTLVGLADGPVTDMCFDHIVPPSLVSQLIDNIIPQVLANGIWEGLLQLKPASGDILIDVHCSIFAVRNEQDQHSGFAIVAHNIGAEKAELTRLAQTAQTFNALIEGCPFGMFVVDSELRVLVVSKGASDVFKGFDIATRPKHADILYSVWPAPFAEELISHFQNTLKSGTSYIAPSTCEERADTHDVESYDWRIDRITLPDGSFGVVCYYYDLTEREKWAAQLQHARDLEAANARELQSLYDEAPLGLAMVDRDLRFTRLNPAFLTMNAAGLDDAIGKTPWEISPILKDTIQPALMSVITSGEASRNITITGTSTAQTGVAREWINHFYPITNQNGDVNGIGFMVQDVTLQRQNEEAIRASEEKLRLVLDQLYAFVGILSPEGFVLDANNSSLAAFNVSLDDIYGRHIANNAWWSHSTELQETISKEVAIAAAGNVVRHDVLVKLGENLVTLDFQLSPLKDRHGAVIGLIVSGVLVEDRIQAQRALLTLTSELEAHVEQRTQALIVANDKLKAEIEQREAAQAALIQSKKLEAIGQLVSGVAHDFNNILAAVLSGLSLIERKTNDQTTLDIVRTSASAARRGAGLIKQMLAFARKQPLTPTRTEMTETFSELRPLINLSLPPGIILKISPADDIWPITVDSGQLHAALLNLALNARDAMPNGGSLTITSSNCGPKAEGRPADLTSDHFSQQDFVAISVTDTGTGMNSDTLAKFAEPFFTTKSVGKGTGLGVAMVYGFVNQSGGTMVADSIEGQGTTITLFLPRATHPAPISPLPDSPEVAVLAKRILVVDDDHDLRFITAATLVELGYDISTADSGARALTLLDNARFDLVITDIVMPDMDGLSLAKAIRANYDPVPILFMTCFANKLDLSNEVVVDKPFESDVLLRNVQRLLVGSPSTAIV